MSHISSLLPTIRRAYNLPLVNMRFLLRGWGGDCYSAETLEGTRYFLKFHDQSESLALAPSSRSFYLPLTYQLFYRKILPKIPHPIPTSEGYLWLLADPYILVITNFIKGELVGYGPLPEEILAKLAYNIALLHSSLPQLTFYQPFVDGFQLSFESIINQFLMELQNTTAAASTGFPTMNAALLPRLLEIQDTIQHLKMLQTYAQSSRSEMVICHTDIHGGNLMIDTDGYLHILDWENAMIAPPEHDLMFFIGEPGFFETFFPIYSRYVKPFTIDFKLLEFYFFRRALEDLSDYILRIRSGTGTSEQDRADILECQNILDSLPLIEKTLSSIQDRIG